MQRLLTTTLFILYCFFTLAQQEDVYLHMDKPFYVSGEVAWFSLRLPPSFAEQNIAISTSWVDGNGQLRDRFFLRNEGKTQVSGYYRIPFEVQAGMFEIQFRLSEGGHNPDEILASFPIPIYNDLANLSNVEVVPAPDENMTLEGTHQISIDWPESLGTRQEISPVVRVTDGNGQPITGTLSISVTDHALCGSAASGYPTVQRATVDLKKDISTYKNDIYVQGRLGTETTPQQVNVLGGYVGIDDKIYYSKSFADGFYSMKLPDFEGAKMIQFLGYQFEHPEVSASVDGVERVFPEQKVMYTEGILDYLKYSRMRKKILQYFDEEEIPLEVKIKAPQIIINKPDLEFQVKEYESFPDMKGFFGEIITTLSFKLGSDSLYTASLYNPKERRARNTNLKGPPLFIIDGKVTRNAHYVANMSMVPIETVEIFTNAEDIRDNYSAIGISGIVKIKTTLQDVKLDDADEEDVHQIFGLQPSVKFPDFDRSTSSTTPVIRPQIFWGTDLETDAEGRSAFSFTASDDTGDFLIEVLFQDAAGRITRTVQEFNIKS